MEQLLIGQLVLNCKIKPVVMHQKLFYLLISLTLLFSCDTEEKKDSQAEDTKKQSSPINCYRYANAGDTIQLKLIHIGNAITGTLVYDYKEKDRNRGTIQGSMKGNLLVADYTFQSEGVQSVRQVAFKLEENSFIEGYGDIDSQNDKVQFKNLDSLKFNNSMKLVGIACQ
jgi:hypothetical protein